MTDTALGGSLPTGDANGLNAIAHLLVANRTQLRPLLVLVDCSAVTEKTDTGTRIATARVRRIEAVLPQDLGTAEKLMRRALERRTGETVLPLDLEDDLSAAFDEALATIEAEQQEGDKPGDDDDQDSGGEEPDK